MAYPSLVGSKLNILKRLVKQPYVSTGTWQAQDVSNRSEMDARELFNEIIHYHIPPTIGQLQKEVEPNLPWAEDHFQERVSGVPFNPPPSEQWWPFAVNQNQESKIGKQFSHTYPERFWPKYANVQNTGKPHHGVRFEYGDLEDLMVMLKKNPLSRQAYLPVWFPEDTGAVHGERVPCTLGYQFMVRGGLVHISYFIRSCDFLRHFQDDVYMAARLAQHVASYLGLGPGSLTMHIVNLHIFRGDEYLATQRLAEWEHQYYGPWMGGINDTGYSLWTEEQ